MNRVLSGRAWLWLLATVLIVIALREPLAERLLPPSGRERLLVAADRALVEGRLSDADGSGARELYAALLALDPDHSAARSGLDQVGQRALTRAEQAIGVDDSSTATAMLEIARAAGMPATAIENMLALMRAGQASEQALSELFESAQRARETGQIDGGSESALALYAELLAREPGNALALSGRNEALDVLLKQAQDRLDNDDAAAALALLDRVERIDPGHLRLPTARALLAQRLGQRLRDNDLRLRAIETALRDGALEGAQAMLQDVVREQPELDRLPDIRWQLGAAWARRAVVETIRGRERDAEHASAQLPALGNPLAERFVDVRRRWWRDRRQSTVVHDGLSPQLLALLLQRSATGEAKGRMRQEALSCFEQAMAQIWLDRAGACLEAADALNESANVDAATQARLAAGFMGVAEERIGRGELRAARDALAAAAAWGAARTDVGSLQQRMEHVGSGARH